jgi:hypothetical protein
MCYDTSLTPVGEQLYRRQFGPQDSQDYDLRGAFAQSGGALRPGGGHLTDQFKKPNHPTFSNESQYSTPEYPGGAWAQVGNQWSFTPSQTNLDQHGRDKLQEYFDLREPGNLLLAPPASARRF